MKFALGDMMDKLGITTHEIKKGQHADLYNSTRPFSKVERKMIRQSMLDVYATFKKRIIDGRGERLSQQLEKLAGGRVYSGRDALRVGLVDEMGGLNDAIAKAAELAELKEVKALMFPEPKSAFDSLFGAEESSGSDHFLSLESPKKPLSFITTLIEQQSALSLLPADKRQEITKSLQQLQAVQEDRIQLIAPALPRF